MAWDATKPTGATKIKDSDDEIRANFAAIEVALGNLVKNGYLVPEEVKNLTTAEIQQLENIGTNTISATQWTNLNNLDYTRRARAYLSTNQLNLVSATPTKILLDAESYDPGTNFASNAFTAPVDGDYLVCVNIRYTAVVADKRYYAMIYVNGACVAQTVVQSASTEDIAVSLTDMPHVTNTHKIELYGYHVAGVDTVDVIGSAIDTFMSVRLMPEV